MKPLPIRNRGISLLGILVIVVVVAVGGFAIYRYLIPWWWPKRPVSTLVRGYLAAATERSDLLNFNQSSPPTKGGKDIYLPGVTVFLEDPKNARTSNIARTDLSGRFSLYAPAPGRYRICWKSPVYGDGCTPVFVSTGSAPQFVSTVHLILPPREGQVAVMGEVTMADGSLVRTFDPFLNINAFAMVGLDDEKGSRVADVYVNNFGDYLLPYVPTKQKVKLTASTESARFTQEIWPEAEIQTARLHQVNLKFENNRPRLDPLVAFDSVQKRRVQNALPGSKVNLQANARDKDGDEIQYAWFLDPSEGALSQTTGRAAEWQLPSGPGLHSVTVVAYDNRGGYDKTVLSLLAGDKGTPFTGVVVEPNGAPVANASVEIVGNPAVKTDANGRFHTNVQEADRYVFNVRKEGYALNSQIYNRSVTGGRWIVRRGQVVTIDPTRDVSVGDKRNERDCPGPDSMRASLGPAGDSLTIPQWQDGQGNIIDPPPWYDGPRSVADLGKKKDQPHPTPRPEGQLVVLPRDLKLPPCGPGVTVDIPANSILDPNGNLATAPIKVTIATVDLLSSQQMPGDDSVAPIGGGSNSLKSFGAGSLDLPSGFKLKPGASARVTIPVDRARLMGGSVPPTVPLLSYDEQKGVWIEEDTLALVTIGGLKMYQGNVKHFSTFNADVLFNNNACLRVFSQGLPGQYDLEVTAPYPDGTLHTKKYTIDNVTSTEHVIYNLVPNTNITLVPMTSGSNSQVLGFYIVNSGPITPFVGNPGAGNSPPGPPYTDCQNFVVLKVGSAPDSPFGGEFLHGLGFLSAVNLGFDDLTAAGPTGITLRDAIVTASRNYYTTLDSSPGGALDSFDKFKQKYGFASDPAQPVAGEIVAPYANSGDLGFGRDMHCITLNGDIACYVTNYGTGYNNIFPGGGTADQDDADAAASRTTVGSSAEVATVAMEYSPVTINGPRVVKFFVYKKNLVVNGLSYSRSISANLDGRGERPVPQLCMICHGGEIPQQLGGVPTFGTAAQVDFKSRFLPFDHRFFTFPAAQPKASQETAIKALNTNIVDLVPTGAPSTDPIREVVNVLYNDATNPNSATQLLDSPVSGWQTGQSLNLTGQTNFYNKVVANACRTCHIAQPFPQLQFNTSDRFVNVSNAVTANNRLMLGTAQMRVCGDYVMPHALRTHDIFWGTYTSIDPVLAAILMPLEFQNFGDAVGGNTWQTGLCTDFISGTAQSPSQFYEQTIQPIWNGKCVVCHVAGNPFGAPFSLVQNVSYDELVNPNPPPLIVRVVPGNDTTGALLDRISRTGAGRMPPGCAVPPAPPVSGQLPCLEQSDIDKVKAWIRSGAN